MCQCFSGACGEAFGSWGGREREGSCWGQSSSPIQESLGLVRWAGQDCTLAQLLGHKVVLSLHPAQECSGLGWGAGRSLSSGSEGLHPVVHACGARREASCASYSVPLQQAPTCLLGLGTCRLVPLGRDKNLQAQFPD